MLYRGAVHRYPRRMALPASDPAECPALDLVYHPHRSLSPGGFLAVMAAIAIAGCATGVAFLLAGAWPVMGFMGLDIALVWYAFRLNYRRARGWERVRLTEASLTVERAGPKGEVAQFQFQPYWLRVEMDDPPKPGSRLTLRTHGRAVEIGTFLGPDERLALARTLREALARQKESPGASTG
jgi:uncharacterized membrane protein